MACSAFMSGAERCCIGGRESSGLPVLPGRGHVASVANPNRDAGLLQPFSRAPAQTAANYVTDSRGRQFTPGRTMVPTAGLTLESALNQPTRPPDEEKNRRSSEMCADWRGPSKIGHYRQANKVFITHGFEHMTITREGKLSSIGSLKTACAAGEWPESGKGGGKIRAEIMRPKKCRRIDFRPEALVFKPAAIPMRELEVVEMGLDELEALRLADLEGLYQEEAALRMGVSRATFGRVLASARHKVAQCLLGQKCLVIDPGE